MLVQPSPRKSPGKTILEEVSKEEGVSADSKKQEFNGGMMKGMTP